jgi:hypothetical protein
LGADVSIEAVGHIANIGVHGEAVTLHLGGSGSAT